MKYKIFVLLAMLAALSIGSYAQHTLNIATGMVVENITETMPNREVENVSDGITVTYVFEKVAVQEDPLFDGNAFYKITGFGMNDVPTEASFPVRVDKFTIPTGQSASVTIEESTYVDYDGVMSPARQPLTDSGNDSYTKDNILPVSPFEGFSPALIVEQRDIQSYRGVNFLNVRVCPIQYNYEDKKIRVYTKIKYKVTFIDSQSDDVITFGELWTDNSNDNFLNNTTLNGNVTSGILKAKSLEKNVSQEYLIISTPKYESAANKFAEWKKLMGMDVHTVICSNWTAETVKSTISDLYAKYGIRYLLIIGDQEDVPGISSHFLNYNYVTDLYYGCMDGEDDYTPDIYRGRLSVSTLAEANTVVDKIINYEKSPIIDSAFYNKGVNCAYFQDKDRDTYADRRFAQTSEEIRNYLISQGKTIERIYYTEEIVTPKFWNKGNYSSGEKIPSELQKPQFSWNGNASNISTSINQGAFYVLHRDHGATWGWGDPQYTSSNAANLTNGSKLPIVFSMNCLTGKYNSGTCFAEYFLRNANGGCVAIFGATEVSYSGYNDALSEGMFDAIWPNPGLRPIFPYVSGSGGTTPTPTYCLGQILDQGMERMGETYGTKSSAYSKYTRELFHCFGDPSMQFPTSVPTSFSNVSITRNKGSVSVTMSETAERITFYDMLTNQVSCYTGNTADMSTDYPQYVSVCISGHNKIPYIDYGTKPTFVYIQNETIANDSEYTGDFIKVGSAVTSDKEQGPVYVNSGTTNLTGTVITISPETTISQNAELKLSIK